MRLQLEEYNFTVEYLRGKDNFVADALSRVTIQDLKDIQVNVLEVTTRYQSRHKFCAENNIVEMPRQPTNSASQPNVFEVIQIMEILT